jgi:hypothetical protein
MTKNEKKKIIKEAQQAGVTDEKLIAAILGGNMTIEQALEGQKSNESFSNGGASEQGENLAGEEPGQNAGSDSQGAAEENKSANDSSEYSKPNAEKEKVFKVKCNLFHNSKEFKKDSAMHEDDKDFKELKELGFLI